VALVTTVSTTDRHSSRDYFLGMYGYCDILVLVSCLGAESARGRTIKRPSVHCTVWKVSKGCGIYV
jgi:hypothetical protein